LHELNSVEFIVKPDVALNAEELAKRMNSQHYDLVVADCPSNDRQGTSTMDVLRQTNKGTPLIFVTDTLQRETVTELAKNGASDCIEMDRIARLPMAVRRTLDEKNLREERDRAEKKLRHSKAHYRALVEHSAYGMCRCNEDGRFLEVNQALVKILGYTSRQELMAANLATDTSLNPTEWAQLLERSRQTGRADPVETDWKRKDGTTVKVRLSGRKVRGEKHALDGYGIIVEDVSDQRALEDHLRKQAASDALTGLANYRQLVDVLDREITRSKRTGREFALIFLDLDGLKKINDLYGHQTGSRALCRLANVLRLCCRSLDTAARYGGDEFALVLPETGAGAAALVARRICELFANDGEEPGLTVSVGVASYPKDAETIGPLLYAADRALYLMKSERRESFSQALNPEI
jgi:diguanylate cyclase (GGDEF)-like protein/PAS domain S-box-containing protein